MNNNTSDEREQSALRKNDWHRPTLTRHGKIEEITKGQGGGGLPDEFESISL
jgi:hypothetical protein